MAGGSLGASGLPGGMGAAVGGAPTAAELGTTASGAGISPMSAFASRLPQILQGIQGAKGLGGHPAQAPAAAIAPHPMSGAPVQIQGLLGQGTPITVPQMNQSLARSNGLLG